MFFWRDSHFVVHFFATVVQVLRLLRRIDDYGGDLRHLLRCEVFPDALRHILMSCLQNTYIIKAKAASRVKTLTGCSIALMAKCKTGNSFTQSRISVIRETLNQ